MPKIELLLLSVWRASQEYKEKSKGSKASDYLPIKDCSIRYSLFRMNKNSKSAQKMIILSLCYK